MEIESNNSINIPVPYPAIFGGCQFFDECSKEKNHCATGEFGVEGGIDKTSTFRGRLLGKKGVTFFGGGGGAIFT